jgi:hypothetical protein
MDREQREMFYWNIVKFIIGIVLLSISYIYIQNHPAEKVSILSWFQVMYERGQVFVYDIFGKDSSVLRQKHRLNQYYQELMRLAESRSCVWPELLSNIFETYMNFSQSTIQELDESISYFSAKANELDLSIQESCPSF